MRRRWRTTAAALALGVAAGVGLLSPAVSQAEPAIAAKDFSKPAIVVLGYGLNPDGTMRPILRRRVMTGLIVAQFFPQSPIIVTGGNPQNGKTEAGQMRNMLQLLGFPGNRIIVEDRANSTVQNAQFSVPLAKQAGTSGIVLVTSTTHQDRADGNFADAGGNVLATVSYSSPGTPSAHSSMWVSGHPTIRPDRSALTTSGACWSHVARAETLGVVAGGGDRRVSGAFARRCRGPVRTAAQRRRRAGRHR
jgi:uncharacterized SAM-binding protein YcdF (DUF218 family)